MGMAPRIGIITAYPVEDWHSRQLFEAASRRGVAEMILPENLAASVSSAGVRVLCGAAVDMEGFDACVLARGFGDQGNGDFLIPIYQRLARMMTVVNGIDALLLAMDKFETSCRLQECGIPTPCVVVAQQPEMAVETLASWGRLVAKPLYGSLGLGVEVLEDSPESRRHLEEITRWQGAVYLQEYVPAPGRDIRAFVIGDEVVRSIFRIAAPRQRVMNVHNGARPEACDIEPAMAEFAVNAARGVGLDYAGVDILEGPDGPVVIEVNGNPLWRGVLEATGCNMADGIIARVVEMIAETTKKGGERIAKISTKG